MSDENTNQTETENVQPTEPSAFAERQDVAIEVTGFQLEILKGL